MKARFDKRQNKVTVKQLNGKDYIFLCLNGKTVKETPEGQDEPQTFYEYDYTEISEITNKTVTLKYVFRGVPEQPDTASVAKTASTTVTLKREGDWK